MADITEPTPGLSLRFARILANALAFAGVTAAVGLATAWYATEYGTRWSVRSYGPWIQWVTAGRPDGDPYARAHAARKGSLPISTTIENSFRASVDSTGSALSASCEYSITVEGLQGAWWSIAAYGNKGQLVQNAAERYAFNTNTVARDVEGRAVISLARDARPGNWLPISGGSQINIVLTILNAGGPSKDQALPEIQRVACR